MKEKFENEKKQLIDVEVNKTIIEEWEKLGLDMAVGDLIDNFFIYNDPDEKFAFGPQNFECTQKFIKDAEKKFSEFKAKNLEEKIDEVRDELARVIMNFVCKELGVDPKNPKMIREERVKQDDKEFTVKYFETNNPDLVLSYDEIYWHLERKEK